MRVLELFCGTSSVGKALRHIYTDIDIISLDIHHKYNPTHAVDILQWNYRMYPERHFDIIWGSPPCVEYSKAKRKGSYTLCPRVAMR